MIKVITKDSEKLDTSDGLSLYLSFKYNGSIVDIIKENCSKRWYHPDTKEWELPCSAIYDLLEIFDHSELQLDENVDINYIEPEKKETPEGERLGVFKEELSWIKDIDLNNFCRNALMLLPEYFFHVPASSSGKYHPDYALGEAGLVRHTKAAMKIAKELFNDSIFWKGTDLDKDIVLTSILLHDGCKSGFEDSKSEYTVFEHPLKIIEFIEQKMNVEGSPYWILIKQNISSHMGPFNTSKKSDTILPLPETFQQKFVHLCDYLASRKFLEVNFDK